LDALFLEVPSSVTLGVLDAVTDISREKKMPQGYQIFFHNIGSVEELAENSHPIRLPKRRFDIKSRHRVRDMLLASVIDMEAKDALGFLGKLFPGLMNASRDCLVCDRTDREWKVYDRNADPISVIRDTCNDIARSYELNY